MIFTNLLCIYLAIYHILLHLLHYVIFALYTTYIHSINTNKIHGCMEGQMIGPLLKGPGPSHAHERMLVGRTHEHMLSCLVPFQVLPAARFTSVSDSVLVSNNPSCYHACSQQVGVKGPR